MSTEDWRASSSISIFKNGDQHQASNDRPVSRRSWKLLGHDIRTQVSLWTILINIPFTDKQHTLRYTRSCETQLEYTIEDMTNTVNDGSRADIFLLDLPSKRYPMNAAAKYYWNATLHQQHRSCPDYPKILSSALCPPSCLAFTSIYDLPEMTMSEPRLFSDDCLLYHHVDTEADS